MTAELSPDRFKDFWRRRLLRCQGRQRAPASAERIEAGPIFRPIDKGGTVRASRLTYAGQLPTL